jgi:phage tail-like protein
VANGDQYLLLDGVAGWRARKPDVVRLVADGSRRAYVLEPLPGGADALLAADDTSFTCPAALAADAGGSLLVADAALNLLETVHPGDPCGKDGRPLVTALPAIGPEGSEPRLLRQPRGVALLRNGGVAVADTGNHRVQVFSPPPYALVHVWSAEDDLGRPHPGDGPLEFRHPWAVAADECGAIYVVDRGNRRVQVIAADGTFLAESPKGALRDPTRLAVGPNGVVAVVDPAATPTAAVWVFPSVGAAPWRLSSSGSPVLEDVPAPRSVAFGPDGRLYVGDAAGLIHVFRLRKSTNTLDEKVGFGVTHFDGTLVDLAVGPADGTLYAIIQANDGSGRRGLYRIDPAAGCATSGILTTDPLDSGLDRCVWHRVELDADLPDGTSVLVETQTFADEDRPAPGSPFGGTGRATLVGADADCLVFSAPGRLLRLRLTLRSAGGKSPVLRRIKVYFPRESYLQYLPAVYQEDEQSRLFLERFLSIFQTEFDRIDGAIDRVWEMFDPVSVPEKFLGWLADWLAVPSNPRWDDPVARLRQAVKGAHEQLWAGYTPSAEPPPLRGTVAGLERALMDYADVGAKVLEHWRLRAWPVLNESAPLDATLRLGSRDYYRRLQVASYSQVGQFVLANLPEPAAEPFAWGAYEFTVFYAADPYRPDDVGALVQQVIDRERPAHTVAHLCPVYPRLRVGVQAMLDVDAYVGTISYLVLNRNATLGYDTILSGSPDAARARQAGLQTEPRVGPALALL